MKRFKKLLAMMLAVVMVVGAVNLPQKVSTVKAATQQGTLSYAGGGNQPDSNRWLIWFDVSGATVSSSYVDNYWNNNTVYVDGVEKSGEGVNYTINTTDNWLGLCLTYTHAPNDGVTHTVIIPKGTEIGDITVLNDVAVVIGSNTGLYAATPVQFTYASGSGQDNLARYGLTFDVTGASGLGDAFWEPAHGLFDNTVYIGETKVSKDGVYFLGADTQMNLYLYYDQISSGVTTCDALPSFTMTMPMGTVLGSSTSNLLVLTKEFQLEVNQGSISENLIPDKTVTLSNDDVRNQQNGCTSGFYFYTSEADELASDITNWTARYAMTTGGIYHNGTALSDAQLVKLTDTLYYVAMDGHTFAAGDVVKIEGMVRSDGYVVSYTAQSFVYDGAGNWTIFDPNFTITGAGECGGQDDQIRWLFRFQTSVPIPGTGFATSFGKQTITINNGTSSSEVDVSFYDGGNGTLGMIVPYASIPADASGYSIMIPAGISITLNGNTYTLTEDAHFRYSSGAWQYYVPFTISGVEEMAWQTGSVDQGFPRWLIVMNSSLTFADGGYSGDYYGSKSITVKNAAGTETTISADFYYVGDGQLTIIVKNDALPEDSNGSRITIPAGTEFTFGGTLCVLTEEAQLLNTAGDWDVYSGPAYYTPTLVASTENSGFTIACANDLPYDSANWSYKYYPDAGTDNGVFVDGVQTDVFLKKYTAEKWYVCLADKGYTAARGTVVTIQGTFTYTDTAGSTYAVGMNETSYIYDGTQWLSGTTLDWDFAITGIGTCEYEEGSGWKLRFETDSVVYGDGGDFTANLGEYTIQVDDTDTIAYATEASGNGLGLLVDGLDSDPQGAVVVIPAGTIGDYTLTNTYVMVYDSGTWKLYHESTDVTLNWGTYNANVASGSFVYTVSDNLDIITQGSEWTAAYKTSGVFVNGKKVDGAKLVCYTAEGHLYLEKSTVLTAEAEDDIVTVKGVFSNGDTYVNFSQVNVRYEEGSWVVSHSYENFNKITVTGYESGGSQTNEAEKLARWLFRVATSIPLEAGTGDFSPYLGTISITIVDPDGSTTDISAEAYSAHNLNGVANRLGFIINYSDGLPEDAEGYQIIINPDIVKTANKTYKITEAATLDCIGGVWQVRTERPSSKGVTGDANGDGAFNAADLISAIKELQGAEGYLCTTDALFAGKSVVTDYDKIHIRERLLDATTSSESAYIPVYLEDEAIELSAYKGPRSAEQDYRYDDEGNALSGYTKTSFLTDTEFARYAAAGLNTLIAEGDAAFASETRTEGIGSGGGHWTNIVNYVELAAKYDLDVYLTSSTLNAYLRGETVTSADGYGDEIEVTETLMQQDLTQLLTGTYSHTHTGIGMLDYDNFKGLMLADEIRYDSLGYYMTANQFLRTIAPDIEVITAFESSGSSVGADYQTFATSFANASLSNDFTYDYYPYQGQAKKSLTWTGSTLKYKYDFSSVTTSTQTDWLPKLAELAGYASEGGFDTGIALQSMSMNNYANGMQFGAPDTKAEIGFQVYTSLAYGMKKIKYFTYWEHDSQSDSGEVYTGSMVTVDANGNVTETDIYRAVQAVNLEILEFDHVFLDYDWRSTIRSGSGDQISSLSQGSSDRIASYSSTNAAIIGCMYDSEKELDGFWLVNATEPEDNLSNSVTVKFNDATRALLYNPAEGIYGELISLTDGSYTATLASGAGQFIIPLQ